MYIHQHPEWWKFHYDADRILKSLAPVRQRQGHLMGMLSLLGFDVQNATALNNTSLDIIKSSEIEGEKLNYDQVRSSVARRLGIEEVGMPESSRYIDGIVDMMLDATVNYSLPLSSNRLMGWHNVLFPSGYSGMYKIEVAQYRTGEMQVVSGAMGHEKVHYQAPEASRVPSEMQRFLQWIDNDNGAEHVLKAAIAHLWFVTIHPFDDGNGRIARAITEMLLARSDKSRLRFYSMSNIISTHRKQYYDLLEATQKGDGDITEWLIWFISCLDEALEHAEQIITTAVEKNRFWDEHRHITINDRQRKIINMMLDGFEGNMTTGRWSRICHCSRDTALNDATDLISKGILVHGPSHGRSTTYHLTSRQN